MEKIPVTIIGGGVVGCAIAYELSKSGEGIFLFEKNACLGEEQSGRNSGVIHAGIYYDKEPLKRELCIKGKKLLYEFCRNNNIPVIKTAKIIVAANEKEDKIVDRYVANAFSWGLEGVKKIYSDEIKKIEPNVEAVSALYSPDTGIFDVPAYLKTLAKLACDQGVEILKETKVVDVKPQNDSFIVEVESIRGVSETFETDLLVNAAGLYSDEIAKMVNPHNDYEILPLRGEYYRFNSAKRPGLNMCGTNVYQVQEPFYIDGAEYLGIGIHLTPTFDLAISGKKALGKNVLVGPTSIVVKSKNDYETARQGAEYFLERVAKFFPNLELGDLEMDYAGSRAKLKTGNDFIIKRDDKYPNAVHLVGIDSPGLTSSLALAEYVARMLSENQGGRKTPAVCGTPEAEK
ncbi:MAG: hypothetical protein CVU80_01180 [Elusimicrobia bacterium HGW-Elusimicrobia-4]|nr:MAG: hypothetical protein CVU80_01180 [Elusimicrobia bacterium HGW-Elusimicrobia-4]